MAIPNGTTIPSTSSFMKFGEGANKLRVISDFVTGWEGWFQNRPFRHEGQVCKIQPSQVDLNKNGKPNINYFWAAIVYNYKEKRVQVLEITQKTVMGALQDLEENEDWGDLKKYDITVNKSKTGDKTSYTVQPSPVKEMPVEARQLVDNSDLKLEKIFEGEYPEAQSGDDVVIDPETGEEVAF